MSAPNQTSAGPDNLGGRPVRTLFKGVLCFLEFPGEPFRDIGNFGNSS